MSFVANGKLVCVPTNDIDFCAVLSTDFDLFVDLVYVFLINRNQWGKLSAFSKPSP